MPSTSAEKPHEERVKGKNPTVSVSDHISKNLGSYESVSVLHNVKDLRRKVTVLAFSGNLIHQDRQSFAFATFSPASLAQQVIKIAYGFS